MHNLGRATLALVGAFTLALTTVTTASAEVRSDPSPTTPPGMLAEQNLAADRTANGFYYRIPALTHLGGGVVLAAWDARPGSAGDSPNPNSIVQRRSTDNGATWGPMTTVAAGFVGDATTPKWGYSDPSYVTDRITGDVFCFFVWSRDVGFAGSQYGNDDTDRNVISTVYVRSADGGLTWGTPVSLTKVT